MKKIFSKKGTKGMTPSINVNVNAKGITLCTKNYLLGQGEQLTRDFITLTEGGGNDSTYHNKLAKIKQLMHRPAFTPIDQQGEMRVGNCADVEINGETNRNVFLEGPVGIDIKLPENHKIITTDTPFGEALLGKKVNEKGSYPVGNLTFHFIVKSIQPYSKAKEIYFPTNKEVTVEKKVEAEAMV